MISLLYVGALEEAAALEGAVGEPPARTDDLTRAGRLKGSINASCWDARRGLYADSRARTRFSQHANALAVLYDAAPAGRWKAILGAVTTSRGIDPPAGILGATYYFSFYLARVLDHAGLSDRYEGLLGSWRRLLAQHFTTWPEQPDPSRSDSHAWSAHPTSGLLAYVAGIRPDAPGFARVRIEPALGTLHDLDAAIATPRGLVHVRYHLAGATMTGEAVLPEGLSGRFIWRNRTLALHPGANPLSFDAAASGALEPGPAQ